MNQGGFVYIMASKKNGTLYTGVTADLIRRVHEHKSKDYETSFTAKYSCFLLVYYQHYNRIEDAISEEKRIKGGNRKQKLQLIENINPEWKDLYSSLIN